MAKTIDLGKLYCLKEDRKDYYGRDNKWQFGDNLGIIVEQGLVGDKLCVNVEWVYDGRNYTNWYYHHELEEYVLISYEEML